ncbi:DUF5336 domain-containing protein [Streptacidiphilus monticola]|uniref:DUF5336 domain-containing protein n=1 Tax=Streptacidiphilus monticola TaxID=2161674 RepID=A0ABW1FY60_9ACTN
MNLRTVTRGDAAIGAAALLLLICSFLPFYSVDSSLRCDNIGGDCSANQWHASLFPLLPSVTFLGLIGAALILLPRLLPGQEPRPVGIPLSGWGTVLAVASFWSALWSMFGTPGAGLVHDYGAYLSFLFALLLAAAAVATPLVPALREPLIPATPNAPGIPGAYPQPGYHPFGHQPVQQAQPGQPFTGPQAPTQPQQPGYGYPAPQPGAAGQPVPQPAPQAVPQDTPPADAPPKDHGTVLLTPVTPAKQPEPAAQPQSGEAPSGEQPKTAVEQEALPVDVTKGQAPAAPAPAFAPFWFAVPAIRPLAPEHDPNGAPVGQLVPGTWYLAIAQQGDALLTQTQEGKRGLLADTSGIQRG